MKSKVVVCLSLVLSGILIGCASVGRKTGATAATQPPITLGRTDYDFKPGQKMFLSLIWEEGKYTRYNEEDDWCGQGDKYSGKFIFRVELLDALAGNKTVDTSLDSLYPDGGWVDFIFADLTQPWDFRMADYNNDGQPDFNLANYGGCSHELCSLFTVTPSGKVEVLKIDGKSDPLVVGRAYDHSVPDFNLMLTGFYYERFDRPNDADYLEFLDWDAKQKTFHSHEQKIVLRQ
ncbi:MAG TPA: hypothetical protein VFC44_17430 [Candidatus Saccharimonadales bacterium]|nr:hypothetical protein [Candidatus Saccharimonadales bacterium]